MNWIKSHYDKFLLALAAALLFVLSAYLIYHSRVKFSDAFASVINDPPRNTKVIPLEKTQIETALTEAKKPAAWSADNRGSLFVAEEYVEKDGVLIQIDIPDDKGDPKLQLHPPIPNRWFKEHKLPILSANVLYEDPDNDGFHNELEFKAKSDPQNAESHPAYVTKLRLKKWIKVPFRLVFKTYIDGEFQINAMDVRRGSQFVKVGQMIEGTKYKVIKFESKIDKDEMGKDKSELTVQDTETNKDVVLVLNQIVNSPDSSAELRLTWKEGYDFKVKIGGVFSLKPEPAIQYKLIDINETEAQIETVKAPQEKIKVPLLEPQK